MAKTICELLWLKKFLMELGFEPQSKIKLLCDNKAAIDIAHNPVQHDRTKYIEIDRHFIKEKLDAKIISIPFVRSSGQLADVLTKPVSYKIFNDSIERLGMTDIYILARGGVLNGQDDTYLENSASIGESGKYRK
jgi:hypothetical protein